MRRGRGRDTAPDLEAVKLELCVTHHVDRALRLVACHHQLLLELGVLRLIQQAEATGAREAGTTEA